METGVELEQKTPEEIRHDLMQSRQKQVELADQVLLLRAEIQWYREQLGLTKNRLYAPSSELTPPGTPGQEYLIFNEAEALADPKAAEPVPVLGGEVAPQASAPKKRKQSGQREMQLATLPVEEVLYTLPEDERVCPQCAGALHAMGQDERREVKVIPAQFVLVVHKREKYACRQCERNEIETPILTAPMPTPAFPNSLASPTSVAYIMGRKFVEGMPLYRQEASLKRSGFELSRQTMANWMLTGANWLESITARMRALLLERDILHADETRLQVLHEDGRKAQSQSFMWLYRTGRDGPDGKDGPPMALYDYRTTRESAHPRQFLSDFRGYLHVDGYAGYEGLPGVTLVGCWSHARRKFFEALNLLPAAARKTDGGIAAAGLNFCDRLFAVERDLRDVPAEVRKLGREAKSKPILDAFSAWLEENSRKVLPKSALGQAIKYCRNQWSKLTVFLEDGRLELDNNRSERSIKPFVIGRKNWLFANTPRGAKASATIYSIVETAKENGLDPFRYLAYLFEQLPNVDKKNPEALDDLLPWAQPVQAASAVPDR